MKMEGKYVSKGMMQKRVDMAELCHEQNFTKKEAKMKLIDAIENWKEHVKKIKKKREEEILDLQDNLLNNEDENEMKNGQKMLNP